MTATSPPTRNGRRCGSFLNQVQEERIGLVAIALGDGGDPPLANFAQLGLADRQQVRQIWDDLVSQKGVDDGTKMGIVIEGAQEAARVRILADFSRLLETATGRMVVGGLSGDQPRLTITPKAGAKFAASPVNEELEGLLAVDQPGPGQQFVALDVSGLSVLERKLRINDVRVNHPKARGVSLKISAATSSATPARSRPTASTRGW